MLPKYFYLFPAVMVMGLLLGACGGATRLLETNSVRALVYVLGAEPGNIDPHLSSEDGTAILERQIYDTLVYRDPMTEGIIPGLATSWTISDDGLVYTFSLRNDVTFHDGTVFNATAVAENFSRIVNLGSEQAKARILLSSIFAGDEIVDDFTIRLKLAQPYAPFLDVLSQPYLGMASPTAFNNYSGNRYQFHQVGTGPFVFQDYIPGKSITIRRNTAYRWGPSFYDVANEASVDQIEFRFMSNSKQRLATLDDSAADIVSNLLPVDARSLTGNSSIQIFPVRIAGQPIQFLINTSRFPTDSLAFRQALIYSANRNFIVDSIFQRFSAVAWSPLTANMLYYDRGLEGAYAPSTGNAQSLLEAAGYLDTNNDKSLDIGGIEASITVLLQSGDLYPDIARSLVTQWRTIGINANIVSVPTFSSLQARIDTNDYNLVAFSTRATDPAVLSDFFVIGGRNNWSKFSDDQLTSLLGQGIVQADEATRTSLYAQIQQQIMNQAIVLPIADPIRLDGALKHIQNLAFDSLGIPILNNVTISLLV